MTESSKAYRSRCRRLAVAFPVKIQESSSFGLIPVTIEAICECPDKEVGNDLQTVFTMPPFNGQPGLGMFPFTWLHAKMKILCCRILRWLVVL